MNLKYSPLLKIQLRHDYFPEGNCPAIEVIPSPITMKVLQDMDVRVVKRDYGVELFYGERQGQASRLTELSGMLHLSFWLRSTDPLFHNYTDQLPDPTPTSVLYATNYGQGASDPADYALAKNTIVPVKNGSLEQAINGSSEDISVAKKNGDLIAEDLIVLSPTADDPTHATIDTSSLQAALYSFKDGDEATAFVAGSDGHRPGDVGLFSLYLGENGEGHHAVIKPDGSIEPASFTLSFSTRATIWRYNLIDSNGGLENFSIADESNGPEFQHAEPPKRTLPDGTEASVLVAASPIELRSHPSQRFLLSYTDESGRAHNNAIQLPNADANRLSRDNPGSTTLYSDLYVYL